MCYVVLHTVSSAYPTVTGKLLTRYAPFRRSPPEYCYPALPLDLHVLSLPLAFILSQDQTLLCIIQFPSSLFEIDALDLLLFGTCFLYFLSVFSMNSVKNPAVLSSGTAKIRTFSKLPNFFSRFFYKNRYNYSGRKITLAESGSYALELFLAILAESSHVRILSL